MANRKGEFTYCFMNKQYTQTRDFKYLKGHPGEKKARGKVIKDIDSEQYALFYRHPMDPTDAYLRVEYKKERVSNPISLELSMVKAAALLRKTATTRLEYATATSLAENIRQYLCLLRAIKYDDISQRLTVNYHRYDEIRLGFKPGQLSRIKLELTEDAAAMIIQRGWRARKQKKVENANKRSVKSRRLDSYSGVYRRTRETKDQQVIDVFTLVYVVLVDKKRGKFQITIKDKATNKVLLGKKILNDDLASKFRNEHNPMQQIEEYLRREVASCNNIAEVTQKVAKIF